MNQVNFFQVNVSELMSGDDGKEKWKVCPYLVEAYTTTEAEAVIVEQYKNLAIDWKIKSIAESKIKEVILRPMTK